jgi:hypothetical protein
MGVIFINYFAGQNKEINSLSGSQRQLGSRFKLKLVYKKDTFVSIMRLLIHTNKIVTVTNLIIAKLQQPGTNRFIKIM